MEELMNQEIDIRNLVVNFLIYPEGECKFCKGRMMSQKKYLD